MYRYPQREQGEQNMRTKKFLSVLLAGSMLVSLLSGVAAAADSTVHKTDLFNTYAQLTTTSGQTDTMSKNGVAKLLLFVGTIEQSGTELTSALQSINPSRSANVIVLFTDAETSTEAGTTAITAHAITGAQYVMYQADITGKLQADYASKLGISVTSPMAVLINSSNRVSLITTGYTGDGQVTDAISTELGLSADSTVNCTSSDDTLSADELTLLRLINKTRGQRPLTTSKKMQIAAHIRALEIAKKFSTDRPNTAGPTVYTDVGLTSTASAENISRGTTPETVMQNFLTTDLTKTNMLPSSPYVHAGIGRQYSSASGYNWAVPLMAADCTITGITVDMPQVTKTTTDANGKTTTSTTPETFATGVNIDDIGATVHLTCSAHPNDENGSEDWICPLTSELCPSFDNSIEGSQTFTVTAYGQSVKVPITLTPANKTVKSIAINHNANTTAFKEGDTLDTTGLEIMLKYSNGSTSAIKQGFTWSPTVLNVPGRQIVTVSYTDPLNKNVFTATYGVDVEASTKVTKIEIQKKPDKLLYAVDETLNTTGLVLTETLSNGSVTTTQTVTSGFTCSPTKLTTTGSAVPITVTCGGQTTSFTVQVVQSLTVDKIDVRSYPTKMSYIVGESFNPAGLSINTYYTDGVTVKPVTSGFTCSPLTFTTSGKQPVTVTYEGNTVSFDVSVTDVAVTSLKIASPPTQTKYYTDDTLATAGLKLTATMNNKTTQTITDGYVCTPTALTKPGTQAITVSFGGQTATFNVSVTDPAVNSIAVTTKPTTLSYVKGTALVTTGMVLTASLANGKTQTVTSGYTCSPAKLSTVGTQTVTVSYKGKTATFTVTVVDTSVSSLTLTTKPTKLSYFLNETLATTGMVLTAGFTDGTTKKVTSGFTCTPSTFTTAGTQTVTVTYGAKTVSFTVTVTTPAISAITIKTKPAQLDYRQGNILQTTGLTLTATTENKTKIDNIATGFTCTPLILSAGGTQTITVTYGGKTATFTVNVKEKTANAAFVDLVAGQWFYDYVNDLTTRGLVNGTYNNDGTFSFRPYSSVTRAEFVAMLARASGQSMSPYYYSSFADVPSSDWACSYITWANANGIVTGDGGYFRPTDDVTRQEMATILTRYNVYMQKSMDMDITPITFADDASIAYWAKNSVIMMQKAGIISGTKNRYGSYSFYPQNNATRAEAAKVISVFLSK